MIDTIKLYSSISVWMTLTMTEGHSYVRKQKLKSTLSLKLLSQFERNLLAASGWQFVVAHAYLVHTVSIQGRELYVQVFIK